MAMLPTRYSRLFRSRWTALMWAAGICWSAVEFTACMDVGPPDNAAVANSSSTSDADNMKQLQTLVGEIEK